VCTVAIVLAAGRGLRFKSKVPKPLVKINSKPAIAYSLEEFNRHPSVSGIIVVVNPANRSAVASVIRRRRIKKVSSIVLGGRRRQDSVLNGLKAIKDCATLVLIHDAARPFISAKIISALIKEAKDSGAAIPAVPVRSTIKKVNLGLFVEETVERKNLWEVQTPQAFRKELLLKAYRRCGRLDVTDDAMLVEKSGAKVKIVEGSYNNIKITTPQDLVLAEAISKSKKY
jgi:2-C-methyl-D-erythritol 4-phosphate cytidylyltransferase